MSNSKILYALVIAALLAGCDGPSLTRWEPLNDYYVQRFARKAIEAEKLAADDPKRLQLEREIEVERAMLEGIATRMLMEGIQVETDDYTVQARRTNSGSFGTVIVVMAKEPVAIPLPGPVAPASTRPGIVQAAPMGAEKGGE